MWAGALEETLMIVWPLGSVGDDWSPFCRDVLPRPDLIARDGRVG
jgi:hypothetical protein